MPGTSADSVPDYDDPARASPPYSGLEPVAHPKVACRATRPEVLGVLIPLSRQRSPLTLIPARSRSKRSGRPRREMRSPSASVTCGVGRIGARYSMDQR